MLFVKINIYSPIAFYECKLQVKNMFLASKGFSPAEYEHWFPYSSLGSTYTASGMFSEQTAAAAHCLATRHRAGWGSPGANSAENGLPATWRRWGPTVAETR